MHQSDAASNASHPALLYSGLVAELQDCSATSNLEVYRGDHDL